MFGSLPRLCLAGFGLCAGGWLIMQAIARRRMRAAGARAGTPATNFGWPSVAPPRTAPERVPHVAAEPAPDPVPEPLLAVANGEDAWW